MVRQFQPCFSSALIGNIEANIEDEAERQNMTRPTPMTDTVDDYLRGRIDAILNQTGQLKGPFPAQLSSAIFGMGCFWGVERLFWELAGVYTTAAGYAAGSLPHPNYREVRGANTGPAEVVLVVYDPEVIRYTHLLKAFWEGHNPARGSRPGSDVDSQYRSVILWARVWCLIQNKRLPADCHRYQPACCSHEICSDALQTCADYRR